MIRLVLAALAAVLAVPVSAGFAAQKAAVFPFELVVPPKEDDFFIGAGPPNTAELNRLKLAYDEFTKLLTAGGGYETVDLAPVAALIEAKSPIHECKGCEIDLARQVGADVAYIVVMEKASDTMLNMHVWEVDVGRAGVVRTATAVVQGNTDDAWLGGVRWIVKNRLLSKKEAAP